MKLKDILDLPLRQILEEYCQLVSLECDYVYGVTKHDTIGEIAEKYDLCDEPSISPEPLFRLDLLVEFENEDTEILTTEHIEHIIDNLGLQEKKK